MSRFIQNNYSSYMKSSAWKSKRDEAFMHYGWKCNRCGSMLNLQVHHKTYERLGDEHMDDLEILCEKCHEIHHLSEKTEIDGKIVDLSSSIDQEGFFKCRVCNGDAWYDVNEQIGGCPDCHATYKPTACCGPLKFEVETR